MTTSLLDAPAGLQGAQLPRICSIPPSVSSAGPEAIELCEMAGLFLDPWQQYVLTNSLGERPDGKWAAFEVGLVVSRQNGKGSLLEARELAGLFLLGERLIVHSAHEFATSLEAFTRLTALIEDTPELRNRVKRISHAHGEEGIELKSGQRVRFRTRTKRGGRGFTADCIILDEAMKIPESAHGALLPTLSARPNPQLWYTGSAVDQEYEEHGVVLARIRERGLAGGDLSLAYFEWSAETAFEKLGPDEAKKTDLWAQANPALGRRISVEHVSNEYASTRGGRTFVVERLGVGDWPSTTARASQIISAAAWAGCIDTESKPQDPVCFAFDVTPDRSAGSIGIGGYRADGKPHIELLEHKPGTKWIIERLAELLKRWGRTSVLCDAAGPAGSLLAAAEAAGIGVVTVTAKEHAQACGLFHDAIVDSGTLRHLDDPVLTEAVLGASIRPLGDAWAWSRKSSSLDISPLVACTLALWGAQSVGTPTVWDMNEMVAKLQGKQAPQPIVNPSPDATFVPL